METVLTLLSVPLLLWVPGLSLLPGRSAPALRMTLAEAALVRVLASVLVTSFCGVVLAQFGLFSLAAVSLAVLLCSLAARVALRREPGADGPRTLFRPGDLWLCVILGVCLFAAASPFEVVTGGGDAGVYVNSGVLLADTGGFDLSDELFDGLGAQERCLFSYSIDGRESYRGARGTERRLLDMIHRGRAERFRGMFLEQGGEDGSSRPQFLPLLPVWMAILHGWGGIWGLLRVNVLLGLFSLSSAFYVGQRVFDGRPGPGMAFSGLLALNVAQFWFMRYPSAELLVQALFLCGTHLVLAGDPGDGPRRRLILLGGGLLGTAVMAKFFGIFLLVPVGLAWFFSRSRGGDNGPGRWRPLLLGLVPVALYGLGSAAFFSAAYLRSHLLNQQYFKFYIPAAVLLALALLLRRRVGEWLASMRDGAGERALRIAAAAVLFSAASYAYFVRPRDIEVAGSNNFVELGWYLTPLGLLLGVAGFAALLLGRGRMPGLARAPFLPWAALVVSLVVLGGTADMPLHIFSIRRFIPVTIPAFLLFGLVPLRWCWGRRRPLGPLAALALGAVVLLLPLRDGVWKTCVHREQEGAVAQLADLSEAFAPEDVLVFDGLDDLALPLRVLFGHQRTLAYFGRGIHAHTRLIQFLQRHGADENGRNLFLTTQPELFGQAPERSFVLSWPRLERSDSRIPSGEARVRHVFNAYTFPDEKAWRYRTSKIDVGGADFPYVEGFHAPATHQRRMRHEYRRAGERSVLALPEGTVKVGLRMARVEDRAATVVVRHGGRVIDRFTPNRDFEVRMVKVARDDGLIAASEMVLSVEPAERSGGRPWSAAGIAGAELVGRFGRKRIGPDDEAAWTGGWGPVETRDAIESFTVRWTGRTARIRAPGSATLLRLNLSNGSRPRRLPPARVTFELNGREVGRPVEPGARFRTVDIAVPPSEYGRNSQILTIESNTWNPYYAGRGGAQDRALGVVVEGLEIIRPGNRLERGLTMIAQGRHQDAQVLIEAYAEQFGRHSDWRIPLGLALAHERAGRVSAARMAYKESLAIRYEENEAYSRLRRLAARHDAALRGREHPGWRERRERDDPPPPVSDPWMVPLVNTAGDSPETIEPGGRLTLTCEDIDHGGLALVYVVAQYRPHEPGGEAGGDNVPSVMRVLLDGRELGVLGLSEERWQSLVFCGEPGPGKGRRLEVLAEGGRAVEVKRVLVY